MVNKRELLIGSLLNLTFILVIVGTRYFYAKQEMDFLREDSVRQDNLIEELRDSVDVLKLQNDKILIDLHNHDKTRGIENRKLKKQMDNFQVELDTIKERLSTKVSIYDSKTSYSSGAGVVPFEKEFGTQDSYLRIFGRTGVAIVNDSIVDNQLVETKDTSGQKETDVLLGTTQKTILGYSCISFSEIDFSARRSVDKSISCAALQ